MWVLRGLGFSSESFRVLKMLVDSEKRETVASHASSVN
jgi:hypothetical protein